MFKTYVVCCQNRKSQDLKGRIYENMGGNVVTYYSMAYSNMALKIAQSA